MIKKLLLTTAALTASAILLTGCTSVSRTDNVIKLGQNYEVDSIASWDESSLKVLQQEGWTLTEQQRQALREDNLAVPQGFDATNPDGTCFVSYRVYATNVFKPDAGDDYSTRETAYNYVDATLPLNSTESLKTIKIDKSEDKLEMLEIIFSYENKVSKSITEEEAKEIAKAGGDLIEAQSQYTVDGEINEAYIVRVTKDVVPNPMYVFYERQNENAPEDIGGTPGGVPADEGNMVIEMKYACKKQPIDMELWDKLVKDAKINFDPLPEVKQPEN